MALLPEDYYDIDTILAGEVVHTIEMENFGLMFNTQKVPCTLNSNAYGLSFMAGSDADPSSDDLPRDTEFQLQMWLAPVLKSRNLCTVKYPQYFDRRKWAHYQDNPQNKDLAGRNPFFYRIGAALAYMHNDRDLIILLLEILRARVQKVIDMAMTAAGEDIVLLTKELTDLEKQLFHFGNQSMTDYNAWRKTPTARLSPSSMMRYRSDLKRSRSWMKAFKR